MPKCICFIAFVMGLFIKRITDLVSSAQRDRSPLGQIWFDTIFQYIIHLVLFCGIILEKAEKYITSYIVNTYQDYRIHPVQFSTNNTCGNGCGSHI